MKTSDVVATIMLVILAFTTMILAVSFDIARVELWAALETTAVSFEIYGQVHSFLVAMEIVFWMIFLISLVGIIIIYFIGSHIEEGETYAPPQEYV